MFYNFYIYTFICFIFSGTRLRERTLRRQLAYIMWATQINLVLVLPPAKYPLVNEEVKRDGLTPLLRSSAALRCAASGALRAGGTRICILSKRLVKAFRLGVSSNCIV